MLARIRRALGRADTATPPSSYLASQFQSQAIRPELVNQFCDELAKVGGHPTVAGSSLELKNCLERIFLREKPALVAVSDVVATAHEELLGINGPRFVVAPPRHELLSVDIGITEADYAIADTGTLVLISGGERHRLLSLLPAIHICILDSKRIFPNLSALLRHLHENVYLDESLPQATTFITGPSRTADIEHVLTTGVHGPGRVEVLLTVPDERGN